VKAINVKKAPFWHHAAGLPVWVFADEVIVNWRPGIYNFRDDRH